MTPGGGPRISSRKAVGRPEITATSAKVAASSASRSGTPGSGATSRGSFDDGGERAVEIEEQCAVLRVGRQRLQDLGQARRCCSVAHGGQRQAAVVVVADAARSDPITTTTSMPVVLLRGVAAEIGSTWAGFTPMVVAMDAACSCWPGA